MNKNRIIATLVATNLWVLVGGMSLARELQKAEAHQRRMRTYYTARIEIAEATTPERRDELVRYWSTVIDEI